MATVEIKEPRIQKSSFALYRTSAGGDESIIVRRKVGDPTDYIHTKSRKLIKQRANLALASQHYASLSPSQKAITRHQIEEVEYQKSHGKTDTKLLMGRQLFISKEMHSLETAQKQLVLPLELCIMLVDENHLPLEGELWLYCTVSGEWFWLPKDEIWTGNWLFSQVPPGYPPYRVYGEAEGYFDPLLPEHQAMTEEQILPYHYHELHLPVNQESIYPNGDGSLSELLTFPPDSLHWQMVLAEDSEWIIPPVGWGWWTGNFVYKNWYPWGERADLYTFTNPLWAAQHVNKIVVHYKVGSDLYPYGQCRVILKTHGQLYYTIPSSLPYAAGWLEREFAVNPQTNKEWTKDELAVLQAGVAMDKVGSFGNLMFDCIRIDIHYI